MTTNIAERYFSAMRARDFNGLLSLFAKDAELNLPDGQRLRGLESISAFYERLLSAPSPSPVARYTFACDQGVATETEITLPDGAKRYTGNFFHLNTHGLITRFSIYARSG